MIRALELLVSEVKIGGVDAVGGGLRDFSCKFDEMGFFALVLQRNSECTSFVVVNAIKSGK